MTVVIIAIALTALCAIGDMKMTSYMSIVDERAGRRADGILPLILGGNRATIEQAPFMALYIKKLPGYGTFCGASILSEKFVLSAAHCYDKTEGNQRYEYILVGTDLYGSGQQYGIEKTIIHPQYNDTSFDCDVLVFKLRGNLELSSKVQPIKMATSELVIEEGFNLIVFGFGMTENDKTSKYLRRVRVPYVNQEKCKAVYDIKITDNMICAGQEGKDSCYGDSGGPLVYGKVLVGVVSFGNGCGLRDMPGVYVSVSRVRKFIDNVIKKM